MDSLQLLNKICMYMPMCTYMYVRPHYKITLYQCIIMHMHNTHTCRFSTYTSSEEDSSWYRLEYSSAFSFMSSLSTLRECSSRKGTVSTMNSASFLCILISSSSRCVCAWRRAHTGYIQYNTVHAVYHGLYMYMYECIGTCTVQYLSKKKLAQVHVRQCTQRKRSVA